MLMISKDLARMMDGWISEAFRTVFSLWLGFRIWSLDSWVVVVGLIETGEV